MYPAEPLISVITVCLNAGKTLERTINSVISQDWPKIEHIIIDGLSIDESHKIIEKYKNLISQVVVEKDKGIYDAMNKGLLRANGDIICFLNADDEYASNNILSLVALKMSEMRLDALMGDVAFLDKNDMTKIVRHYRSDRFSPNKLAWGWMPAHPGLFLHRHIVKQTGLFKTDYSIAGDFEFIVRIFHNKKIRYQHLCEILVLMHSGGVSNNNFKSKIILNKEVLRACRENGLKTNIFKILSKYPLKFLEIF